MLSTAKICNGALWIILGILAFNAMQQTIFNFGWAQLFHFVVTCFIGLLLFRRSRHLRLAVIIWGIWIMLGPAIGVYSSLLKAAAGNTDALLSVGSVWNMVLVAMGGVMIYSANIMHKEISQEPS